jgi:hypothetical protein
MITPHKHHIIARQFPLLLVFLSAPLLADKWMPARPFATSSANGRYVAAVTPGERRGAARPTLELFKVEDGKRTLQWRTELSNQESPYQVLVTDDGNYVVTLDEYARIGYGDEVVAIYGRGGKIKNYSLESIAGDALKPRITRNFRSVRFDNFPHSAGSRWWRNNSIMALDGAGEESQFAIWLDWAQRWYVWSLSNGSIKQLEGDALKKWDDFGWNWSQAIFAGKPTDARAREPERGLLRSAEDDKITACRYLGYTRRPQDRKLLEKLLESNDKNRWGQNAVRKYATWSLAMLDGFDPDLLEEENDGFVRLGTAKITVHFSQKPSGGGTIHFYVFPESVKEDAWSESDSLGGMTLTFHDDEEQTMELFPAPVLKAGRYWAKVIWLRGKIEDYDARHRKDRPRPVAGPNDFETAGAELFEITPGKTVEVKINCQKTAAKP